MLTTRLRPQASVTCDVTALFVCLFRDKHKKIVCCFFSFINYSSLNKDNTNKYSGRDIKFSSGANLSGGGGRGQEFQNLKKKKFLIKHHICISVIWWGTEGTCPPPHFLTPGGQAMSPPPTFLPNLLFF